MANKYKAEFTKPPPTQERWSGSDSLGSKIETMFMRFVQRVVSWGYEFFAELLVDIFDQSMKIMRPGLARAADPIIQNLLAQGDLPAWYRSALENALNEKGESAWYIKLAVFYSGVAQMIFGGLAPIRRLAEYNADKAARSYLPSPQELATLSRVGLVGDNAYRENMAKLGIAEPLIPVYLEYVRNLPSLGELFNALWRGLYSEGDFTAALGRMGYNDRDAKVFLELSKNLPPLQDFIRFQVRDAFDESVSQKYGYDEGDLTEVNKFAAKLGYDNKLAQLYWRAHWQLPSPTQAYEMLHRGLIKEGELEELLRISDYPKFWRENLMKISFNPITRVDLRRLYQAGIIPEDRLLQGYLDIGYKREDAEALTEFAKRGVSEKEKELTRADVLGLYEDNLLDHNEVADALMKLGYDVNEAEILLDSADFNIAKAQRMDFVNYAHERYLVGLLDATGVITELTGAGLTQNQIDRYLLQWDRAIETSTVLPSKADVIKFYASGFIDEADYRTRLSRLGYNQTDVELYVKIANEGKQTPQEGLV